MGVFPAVFLKPMEPAVTRIVERLQNTQTLRVRNEMQKAKFKMQTVRVLQPVGEQRDGVHPTVP
jgi:hypothetical protein